MRAHPSQNHDLPKHPAGEQDQEPSGPPSGTSPPDDPTPGTRNKPTSTGRSRGGSGLRAHIQVTVGLETLLGLNEEPADLDGHGPITADTARDLAFDAGSIWRRLVTDPLSGQLLDYGRTTYRPPVGLADFVRARDVTCRTPSCDRPARSSELDHIIAWPAGTTSEPNLHAKCDHDHTLKHQGRWKHQLSTDPDHPRGTVIIISPTGHVYLSYPYTYPQSISKNVAQERVSSTPTVTNDDSPLGDHAVPLVDPHQSTESGLEAPSF
jgi:hypothetical protein